MRLKSIKCCVQVYWLEKSTPGKYRKETHSKFMFDCKLACLCTCVSTYEYGKLAASTWTKRQSESEQKLPSTK